MGERRWYFTVHRRDYEMQSLMQNIISNLGHMMMMR
jgi:hypothetical protein